MTKYEKFLKWTKDNNIELYDFQKQVCKAYFENRKIILPRHYEKCSVAYVLEEFYKNN